MRKVRTALLVFLCLLLLSGSIDTADITLETKMVSFDRGYRMMNIPEFGYDYKQNFQNIADFSSLQKQEIFFIRMDSSLQKINRQELSAQNKIHFDHILYELRLNRERIRLEKEFRSRSTEIPNNGLSALPKGWYQYYIRFFTSIDITPEELFEFGQKEVARVQKEIKNIQKELGYKKDSTGFYNHLQSKDFFLMDKNEILKRYDEIKATVNRNLYKLFIDTAVTDVAFMEWPDAGRFTPPGYYSPVNDNAYGTAVFFFNFYERKHNKRSMEWLYMHEAVPGHHYQSFMRQKLKEQPAFKSLFYYPGNFEGWGAYVEYLGKDLGLYNDIYSFLGKWEWDLVRSVRILIDVGIHHYGWTKEQAIDCWKKNIPGQDEIAEREVTRCTNWPAQALSYKVGAWEIMQLAEKIKKKNPKIFSLPKFHQAYLEMGQVPLQVIEKNL